MQNYLVLIRPKDFSFQIPENKAWVYYKREIDKLKLSQQGSMPLWHVVCAVKCPIATTYAVQPVVDVIEKQKQQLKKVVKGLMEAEGISCTVEVIESNSLHALKQRSLSYDAIICFPSWWKRKWDWLKEKFSKGKNNRLDGWIKGLIVPWMK